MKDNSETSSIVGWGIGRPDELEAEFFKCREIKIKGCIKADCRHYDHSPVAEVFAWIPKENVTIVYIGKDNQDREYYIATKKTKKLFLIVIRGGGKYWDYIKAEPYPLPEFIEYLKKYP